MNVPENTETGETRLDSWKAIAEYLDRNTTTARRWEREEGLPVHRHSHKSRSSVYAYPSEIDTWRLTRKLTPEPVPPTPLWRGALTPTFALTILLCLIMGGNGIRTASAQGVEARQITGPDVPDFDWTDGSLSRDGRWTVSTEWDLSGDLEIRDMGSGKKKRLFAKAGTWEQSNDWAAFPLFSADQKQIAYSYDSNTPTSQLRVMPNRAGAPSRVVASNSEFIEVVACGWTKDGNRILASAETADHTWQLLWVNVADGAVKSLKSMEWSDPIKNVSLSPDSRWIAYSRIEGSNSRTTSIRVLSADGVTESVLVQGESVNETPLWTPDGSHVVFGSNRGSGFGLWEIAVQDGKATGWPHLLKADTGRFLSMGFTAPGAFFYTRSTQSGGGNLNVFTAQLDTATGTVRGSATPLSDNFVGSNLLGAWSPDGKSIAFLRKRPGGRAFFDVVVRSLQTGDEKTYFAPDLSSVHRASWMEGGKSLVIPGREPQGSIAFYRLDLASGKFFLTWRSTILSGGGMPSPVLSPDGKTIYSTDFQDKTNGTGLFAFDLATGARKQIAGVPGVSGVMNGELSLSADGRMLAFILGKKDKSSLCSVSVDGTGLRELYTLEKGQTLGGRSLVWSGDDGWIYFSLGPQGAFDNNERRLMRISAAGGSPEVAGPERTDIRQVDMSPDGSRILFESGGPGPKPELWALENLLSGVK